MAHPHQATRIGDKLFAYDADGNLTRTCRADLAQPGSCSHSDDHLRRLFWDDEDRLIAVTDGGGRNTTRFVYDAGGNRVVKEGHLGTSITVGPFFNLRRGRLASVHVMVGATRLATHLSGVHGWNASGPVSHGAAGGVPGKGTGPQNTNGCVPSDNQPQKCPGYVSGNPVAGGTPRAVGRPHTYYYHPDHLGSTSWVTDESSRVREHVSYFPYGSVWRDPRGDADGPAPETQAFLFTGKEYDQETGYYYFGARYYDPEVARWLSTDPVVLGATTDGMKLSLYAYVAWRPIDLTDPTGRGYLGFEAGALIALAKKGKGALHVVRDPLAALNQLAAHFDTIGRDLKTVVTAPHTSNRYWRARFRLAQTNPVYIALVGGTRTKKLVEKILSTPVDQWTASMGYEFVMDTFQAETGIANTIGLATGAVGAFGAADAAADADVAGSDASALQDDSALGGQDVEKSGGPLAKTGPTYSVHVLEQMAKRGITPRMVIKALEKGKMYWDPKNKVIDTVLSGAFGSGKDLLVGRNPVTGNIATVIRGTKLVRPRFVPLGD